MKETKREKQMSSWEVVKVDSSCGPLFGGLLSSNSAEIYADILNEVSLTIFPDSVFYSDSISNCTILWGSVIKEEALDSIR